MRMLFHESLKGRRKVILKTIYLCWYLSQNDMQASSSSILMVLSLFYNIYQRENI